MDTLVLTVFFWYFLVCLRRPFPAPCKIRNTVKISRNSAGGLRSFCFETAKKKKCCWPPKIAFVFAVSCLQQLLIFAAPHEIPLGAPCRSVADWPAAGRLHQRSARWQRSRPFYFTLFCTCLFTTLSLLRRDRTPLGTNHQTPAEESGD